MNKFLSVILVVLFALGSTAHAAPRSLEQKVADDLAVYQGVIELSEEQSQALEEGLTKKLTIGQQAYELKKAGEAEKGKAMNQQAGKEFHKLLRATLTKEQWQVYEEHKDEIKQAMKDLRK